MGVCQSASSSSSSTEWRRRADLDWNINCPKTDAANTGCRHVQGTRERERGTHTADDGMSADTDTQTLADTGDMQPVTPVRTHHDVTHFP